MHHLIANLADVRPRKTFRNGREQLVVPVSMIVPGVLNGSEGPILYTKEENAKSADSWNGVPVTVNHPVSPDGKAISARQADVLEKQAIGTVFNTQSNGKLKAEAWLDVQNTMRIDPRIIESIKKGKPIELSTGLFMDTEAAPQGAVHNGSEPYSFIARNYRPDHLAILPDEKGACSIKDGCGVLVNTGKGMSHEEVRNTLDTLLRGKFTQDEEMPFIEEVFDDFMIFTQGGKMFRQKFNTSDGKIKLSRNTTEVKRKVDFVPVGNLKGAKMADKKTVDTLISNCECWNEDDREVLNAMEEEKVQALVDNAKKTKEAEDKAKAQEAVVNAAKKGFQVGNDHYTINDEGKMVRREETPTANSSSPQKNDDSRLTDEEKEDLAFARNERNRQKSELVSKIVANVDKDEQEALVEVLNKKSLDDLRVLAKLAPKEAPKTNQPKPSYVGAAAPIGNTQQPKGGVTDNPLRLPTINWAEEAKK